MVSIKINGLEFLSKVSISILEACKNVGIVLPRFCYHELLSISGNCRMCLVEVESLEKPVASCVTEIEENMSVFVNSAFVKKARENVIEAILLHHPLDCPICDQAGECDLQDQAKTFGSSSSRYSFNKKTVEDKDCGVVIKTIMTRCIRCTRCVRFAEEISGVNYFGTLNRGVDTEIGNYSAGSYDSELSGNVVDLCPVGALTVKTYAFKGRPWYANSIESIDVMDSLGSNIYVNYGYASKSDYIKEYNPIITRILPRNNKHVNKNMISDKARECFDLNSHGRLRTYLPPRNKWKNFYYRMNSEAFKTKPKFYAINQSLDMRAIFCLKYLKNVELLKNTKIADLDSIYYNSNFYVSNQQHVSNVITNLKNFSVYLGTNLRFESSVLNSRIRSRYAKVKMRQFVLGNVFDSNLPTAFIALNISNVLNVFEGKCLNLSNFFAQSKSSVLFVGQSLVNRVSNLDSFCDSLLTNIKNIKVYRIYSSCNSDGLKWSNIGKSFLANELGCDFLQPLHFSISPNDNFVFRKAIDSGYFNKDYLFASHKLSKELEFSMELPLGTWYENSYTYFNLEHRPQKTQQIYSYPFTQPMTCGFALEQFYSDVLSENRGLLIPEAKDISYFSHVEEMLKYPNKYNKIRSTYKKVDFIKFFITNIKSLESKTKIYKYPMKQTIKNFYLAGPLARYSSNLLERAQLEQSKFKNF